MQCPFCGQDNDKVVDSRSAEGGRIVRRRRQCVDCNKRFTTYERPEEAIRLMVIKKDGAREPYDRNKILAGLQNSCYKRKVSEDQLTGILEDTEEAMFKNFDKEVPSSFIGDEVMSRLRNVDKIAYVRFASVYREFSDVGELISEANGIKDAPTVGPEQRALFGQVDDEKVGSESGQKGSE